MPYHRLAYLCVLLGSLVSACVEPDEDACASPEPVAGRVVGVPLTGNPVRGDLELSGSASQPAGAAIHDLSVVVGDGLRIEVEIDEEQAFERWSATVPLADLKRARSADGTVALSVEARDGCGETTEIASYTLTLDPSAGLQSLTLLPPNTPIPANGTVPAEVRIEANAEAVGAEVALSVEGLHFGDDVDTKVVVLSADPADASIASTTVLVRGTAAGIGAITAEANGKTERAELHVAGPPVLAPATATLGPGQSVTLSVFFEACEGAATTCRASSNSDVTVISGATDLELSSGGVDGSGDGKIDVVVTVADDVAEDSTLTIVCTDIYEQSGSAMLAIVAAAGP